MTNRRRREAGRERQPLMAHKRITLLEKEKLKEEKLKGEKIWLARVSKDNRKGASEDKKGKRQRKSSNLFQYQFSNYTFIHHTCKTNKSLHSVQINFSFLRLTSTGLGWGWRRKQTWENSSSSIFFFLCLLKAKFSTEGKCGGKFIAIFPFHLTSSPFHARLRRIRMNYKIN